MGREELYRVVVVVVVVTVPVRVVESSGEEGPLKRVCIVSRVWTAVANSSTGVAFVVVVIVIEEGGGTLAFPVSSRCWR